MFKAVFYEFSINNLKSSISFCQLPPTGGLLPTADCPLVTADCQLPTAYFFLMPHAFLPFLPPANWQSAYFFKYFDKNFSIER
jgi:hypothetical protein